MDCWFFCCKKDIRNDPFDYLDSCMTAFGLGGLVCGGVGSVLLPLTVEKTPFCSPASLDCYLCGCSSACLSVLYGSVLVLPRVPALLFFSSILPSFFPSPAVGRIDFIRTAAAYFSKYIGKQSHTYLKHFLCIDCTTYYNYIEKTQIERWSDGRAYREREAGRQAGLSLIHI